MSIINRRNAIIGFLAWEGAKVVAKRKAKQAIPGVEGGRRPKVAAIVAALAAAAGALMFWRWWRENGTPPEVQSTPPEPPAEAG